MPDKLSARTEITSGLTVNDLMHLVNAGASWKLKLSTLATWLGTGGGLTSLNVGSGSITGGAISGTTIGATGTVTVSAAAGLINFSGATLGQITSTGDFYINPASGKTLYLGQGNPVAINSTGLAVTGVITSARNTVTGNGLGGGTTTATLNINEGGTRQWSLGAGYLVSGVLSVINGSTGLAVLDVATTGLAVTGTLSTTDPAGGAGPAWKLGIAASVSPTSPNRTIRIDIAGTSYYLHAKTTND